MSVKRVSSTAIGAPPPKRLPGGESDLSGAAPVTRQQQHVTPPPQLRQMPNAEYNPERPNDYDREIQKRMEVKIQEQHRADEERRAKEAVEEKRQWELQENARIEQLKPTLDTLQMSAEEAFRRRIEMSKSLGSVTAEALEVQEQSEKEAAQKIKAETERKMSFAERMLAKQGWEHGQGLGKKKDGVAAPLEVQRVSKTVGVISQAAVSKPGGAGRKKGNTKIVGQPTKVVLLRNMVHKGGVDSGLKREVAQECQKYGDVRGIEVYENPDPSAPPEDSVRVFIKFQRGPEAIKAVVELDGRSFDHKVISACFYDETKFELKLLSKQPEEPLLPPECRTKP